MKKTFFQTANFTIGIFLFCIFMSICGIIFCGIHIAERGSIIVLVVLIVILLLFLFVLFKFFLFKVIIDEEKVVVKGIFGTKTQCYIEEIQKVYEKEFFKEGCYYVLVDNREVKNPYIFNKKGGYVRFKCNKKTAQILKTFWHGDIEILNAMQDLPM